MEIPTSDNEERAFCVFQLGTEVESTQATLDIYEKEAAIEIDYSSLREDLKVIERFLLFMTDLQYSEYLNTVG